MASATISASRAPPPVSRAEVLADVGIDLNLAPVVDLLNPANLTVSARRRSFSSDPASLRRTPASSSWPIESTVF